jgi:hypothetical protein
VYTPRKEDLDTRKLEDRVTRDKDGKITSSRKREDTAVRQTDCQWRVRLAFIVIHRGDPDGVREWRFTQVSLTHQGH